MTITKFATATLVAVTFASASFAGTLTEPEITEVEEAAASSDGGILLPLLGLLIVGGLIAANDS